MALAVEAEEAVAFPVTHAGGQVVQVQGGVRASEVTTSPVKS